VKVTRFYEPDDSEDQMNENDEDYIPASYQNLNKPRNSV